MTRLHDAATVVVLRPDAGAFELYMLRRHGGHEFMPDVWVFPGGRIEERDRRRTDVGLPEDFDAGRARDRLGASTDESIALGLHVGAIRETFEESGLLLARHSQTDRPVDGDDASRRLDDFRETVDDGDRPITELADDRDLVLAVDDLQLLAHWITPHFEDHRYDTRFFATCAPPNQQPSHDERESTSGRWWSPSAAITAYRDGDIELAPPTLRILEELEGFDSVEQLLGQLADRPRPPAILPALREDADRPVLLLPGDPAYPDDDPRLDAATSIDDGVTRLVRRDGQWFSSKIE